MGGGTPDQNLTYQYMGGIAGYCSSTMTDNIVCGAKIPASKAHSNDEEGYGYSSGAIAGNPYSSTNNNYYINCKVAGTTNATDAGVGYFRNNYNTSLPWTRDLTENDGAVSGHLITLGSNIISDATHAGVGTHVKYAAKAGSIVTLNYDQAIPEGYQVAYTVTDAADNNVTVVNGNQFAMPASDVTVTAIVNPIPWSGSGNTTGDPYVIEYASQWNLLAANVNSGTNYSGKFFRLDADISVTEMVGSHPGADDYRTYQGTFDGNGHTITVDYTTTEEWCGPFAFTFGATIKNLITTGTINTSAKHAGGVVGRNGTGRLTLNNVKSSVTINSTYSGSAEQGGLVGYTINADIVGCAFTGRLLGANSNGCGGFIGWKTNTDNSSANITNSLFAPAEVTVGPTSAYPLARNSSGGVVNVSNCYYTQSMGTAQGKAARSISAGTDVTVANAGTETVYNVSGITSYGTGIKYQNVLYAGDGENVSLTLGYTGGTPQYQTISYAASAGTISGMANPYTLAMPDENVTINANMVDELWSGSGTEADPYLIQNTYDLDMLAYRVNNWPVNPSTDSYYIYPGTYFKMTADIDYSSVPVDANGCNYTPIGVYNSTDGDSDKRLFRGVFDGDGHVVSGIAINSENSCKGLFANNCGTVRNVAVSNSSIAGHSFIGAIVGQNDGVVENCHAASNVTVSSTATLENLNTYCGGIVGYNYGTNGDLSAGSRGIVSLCTSAASVTNTKNGNGHGGIAGYNNGRVSQCIYSGTTVEGNSNVGPVVGTNVGTVSNNYWTNNAFSGCSAADDADNTAYITTHAAVHSAMNQSGYSSAFLALAPSFTLNGRTLYRDGDWNTLCLPFDLGDEYAAAGHSFDGTPLEGATVMELSNSTNATRYDDATGTLYLNFVEANKILAGHAYIVKWTTTGEDIVNPTFSGVFVYNESPEDQKVTSKDGKVTFRGTYAYTSFTDVDYATLLLGSSNELYYPQSGARIGAFRAYFELDFSVSAEPIRAFVLNFSDGEQTDTRISDKLLIEQSADCYDIQGRRVNAAKKGVYIMNGKKIFVK